MSSKMKPQLETTSVKPLEMSAENPKTVHEGFFIRTYTTSTVLQDEDKVLFIMKGASFLIKYEQINILWLVCLHYNLTQQSLKSKAMCCKVQYLLWFGGMFSQMLSFFVVFYRTTWTILLAAKLLI